MYPVQIPTFDCAGKTAVITGAGSGIGQEAAGIYSDILTHVSTSVLQFINGDLDVDDDAVWNSYVAEIEGMNLDGLTEIVQTAYDRAHS